MRLSRPIAILCMMAVVSGASAEGDIAQKVAPCAACHGAQGRAGPDGYYPRIAGKPAGYLFNQLVNFREGRRVHAVMSYMVDRQRDEYLMEMAHYFASLDLPYAPPAKAVISPDVLARGEALVRRGDAGRQLPSCVECHGQKLTGIAPSIPGLLGLPRDYLVAQFGAWRVGTRNAPAPDCMGDIARKLTKDEIDAVTSWLAMRTVPGDARPATNPSRLSMETCGSS